MIRYKSFLAWISVVVGMFGERHMLMDVFFSFKPIVRIAILVACVAFLLATLLWAIGVIRVQDT